MTPSLAASLLLATPALVSERWAWVFAAVTMVVAGGVCLLAWASVFAARREHKALRVLRPAPLTTPLLVVIPARNEADRLPATLAALLAEPSPLLRVVVVDDASTDATANIVMAHAAKDPRLSLRRPTWPPTAAHLFGKPRALHDAIAADTEHGHVLCLDADVVLQAGALGGAMEALGDDDALTVLPALDNRTLTEAALVPAFAAMVGLTHPPSAVHDPARSPAFLNGQFILLRRPALDDVGGFAAVGDTVLEDVALARRLKGAGHRLRIVDGRSMVRTRMYVSFAEIVSGFSKNARALHGAHLPLLAVGVVVLAWLPWVALGAALWSTAAVDDVVCAGALLATLAAAMANRRTLQTPVWLGLFTTVVQTVVGVTLLLAHLRRHASWRGRSFST